MPHDADIGICGRGPNLEAAFEQAAIALTAVVCDPAAVCPKTPVLIQCKAPDVETLFVDWLNRIVYEMAIRNMLFSRFDLALAGNELTATLWGEEIDPVRHEPAAEVKGATFSELSVCNDAEGCWRAQCILDV